MIEIVDRHQAGAHGSNRVYEKRIRRRVRRLTRLVSRHRHHGERHDAHEVEHSLADLHYRALCQDDEQDASMRVALDPRTPESGLPARGPSRGPSVRARAGRAVALLVLAATFAADALVGIPFDHAALQLTHDSGWTLWAMAVGIALSTFVIALILGVIPARFTTRSAPAHAERRLEWYGWWLLFSFTVLGLAGLAWMRADYVTGEADRIAAAARPIRLDPTAAASDAVGRGTGFTATFTIGLFIPLGLLVAGMLGAYLHERLRQDVRGQQDGIVRREARWRWWHSWRRARLDARIVGLRRSLHNAYRKEAVRQSCLRARYRTSAQRYRRGVLAGANPAMATRLAGLAIPTGFEWPEVVDHSVDLSALHGSADFADGIRETETRRAVTGV